jgi:tRNA threonylcarbamoyladenosine biosynthesis protein TsaE
VSVKGEFTAENEQRLLFLGRALSACQCQGITVYLQGDLGMGKTTFSRGVITGFGHGGAVKSPTYTLVEPYVFDHITVYHFDLYRLGDPEELEYMGIRDYFSADSLCLIEWPMRGSGVLKAADIELTLTVEGEGRKLAWHAMSEAGVALAGQWQQQLSAAASQC